MATTWDPSAKGAHVSLSNGDLTAAFDGTDGFGTAVRSVHAGGGSDKLYFEAELGATDSELLLAVGFCNGAFNIGADLFYDSPNAIIGGDGGDIYTQGNPVGSQGGGSLSAGDRVCCAIDTANKKAWFRKNGGDWNNSGVAEPATNTGGASIAGAGPYYAFAAGESASSWIAVFSSGDWSYTPPSGFTEINPAAGSYILAGSAAGAGAASGAVGTMHPIGGVAGGAAVQVAALAALRPVAGSAAGAGSASAVVGAGPGAIAGIAEGAAGSLGEFMRSAPVVGSAAALGLAVVDMRGGSLWEPVTPHMAVWEDESVAGVTWTSEIAASGAWS